MTRRCCLAAILLSGTLVSGQANERGTADELNLKAAPYAIPLWEHGAPGALGNEPSDVPSLTVYHPVAQRKAATAIIVAPGGGYSMLASNHEGRQVANWLNALGVAAFVLTYRLGPRYRYPIELEDAERAVRLVRSQADELGFAPDRIGMMGFSAGGHLAAMVGTHFHAGDPQASDPVERVSSRPDFLILAYPVISFTAPYSHTASQINLLGENPSLALRQEVSDELHVTSETPPTFFFATNEDALVPPENSVSFYLALRKARVPAELHIFEKGPHGVGLPIGNPVLGEWPTLLANWLRERGLLEKR